MGRILLVLAVSCCVGACSDLSCALPDAPTMPGLGLSRSTDETIGSAAAVARAESNELETTGSIGPGTNYHHPTKSEFVLQNPQIFSKTEDQRPWPLTGSDEAIKQQRKDEERDKEISQAVHICNC